MDHHIATYYQDDEITITLEYLEGHHLVHLSTDKLTPSKVRRLRGGLIELLKKEHAMGQDLLFTTGIGKNKPKLFNMIKPCFMVDPVPGEEDIWVASWETDKWE